MWSARQKGENATEQSVATLKTSPLKQTGLVKKPETSLKYIEHREENFKYDFKIDKNTFGFTFNRKKDLTASLERASLSRTNSSESCLSEEALREVERLRQEKIRAKKTKA